MRTVESISKPSVNQPKTPSAPYTAAMAAVNAFAAAALTEIHPAYTATEVVATRRAVWVQSRANSPLGTFVTIL
jgi:hypothetical protein